MENMTQLSINETTCLNKLSVDDLFRLHYEKETYFVKEALKLPLFSDERNQLLSKGYECYATK